MFSWYFFGRGTHFLSVLECPICVHFMQIDVIAIRIRGWTTMMVTIADTLIRGRPVVPWPRSGTAVRPWLRLLRLPGPVKVIVTVIGTDDPNTAAAGRTVFATCMATVSTAITVLWPGDFHWDRDTGLVEVGLGCPAPCFFFVLRPLICWCWEWRPSFFARRSLFSGLIAAAGTWAQEWEQDWQQYEAMQSSQHNDEEHHLEKGQEDVGRGKS